MEERREWQKHIFGKAKEIGITDNEDLHALVSYACGKESLKEITKQDYLLIIKELEKRFSESYKRKKSSSAPQTRAVSGMSEGQIKMVWHLMYELKKFDTKPVTATLAQLIGIENYIKLSKRFGGDSSLYIQKFSEISKNARNREIRKKYNGYNIPYLANLYNLSERQIRLICCGESDYEQLKF